MIGGQTYTLGDDILTVENVSLKIDEKLILRDINLNIKDIIRPGCITGQTVGLLGPSGRGKTQLFKILSGLNKPTTGTVLLGNDKKPVKPGDVGVVAQNYPLFEYLTVKGNLQLVCSKPDCNTQAQIDDKVNFYLDRFKMTEHKDKFPAILSGGQRQRIAIIQQMICSEYFILMDEPFSGLDPLMTHQVCEMIETVANLNEKNTIIIVSHDIPSTIAISEYIWLLGFDYDEQKNPIPGARIKYQENLMDMGLTWRPDLTNTSEFYSFVKDIRNAFNDL
jgi:polar amino acid transport system ATP-binding protein/sulfate transport system ATP-binding protein